MRQMPYKKSNQSSQLIIVTNSSLSSMLQSLGRVDMSK